MKYSEIFFNLDKEATELNTTSKNSVDDYNPFFDLSEDENESFDTSNSANNEVYLQLNISNTIDDQDNHHGHEFSILEYNLNNSNPDFDPYTCHLPKLISSECPQDLGRKTLDAQTKVRVIKVIVTLKNICPNRPLGLVISAFVKKDHRYIGVGEICDIVCSRDWKCFKRTYNLVIAVPLCSDEVVYLKSFGNYVNCRDL